MLSRESLQTHRLGANRLECLAPQQRHQHRADQRHGVKPRITRANFADTLRQDVFYIRYDATTGTIYNFDKSFSTTSANYPIALATLQASYRILDQTDASKQGQVPCMDYNPATGEMVVCMLDGLSAGNPRTVQVISITNLLTSPVLGSWTVVGNTDITCTAYAIRFRADGTLDVLFSTPSVAIPLTATSGSFGEGGDINLVSRSPAGVWGSPAIVASCGRPTNTVVRPGSTPPGTYLARNSAYASFISGKCSRVVR